MSDSGAVRHVIALIRKYGLDKREDHWAATLHRAVTGRLSDPMARQKLLQLEAIAEHAERMPTHLLEVPTSSELHADGAPEITLGVLKERPEVSFGLRITDRARSGIFSGGVGSGKTTAMRKVIHRVYGFAKKHGIPLSIIVFDRKAAEYADCALLGADWVHLSAHQGSWAGLNGPDGVAPHIWETTVCGLFAAAFGLQWSAQVMTSVMRLANRTLNPVGSPDGLFADLRLILELVRTAPGVFCSKRHLIESLDVQLDAVNRASGDLFRTFNGLNVPRDIIGKEKSVVIDVASLEPPALRMFLVWLLTAQIMHWSIATGQRLDGTRVLLVVDEADQDVQYSMERRFADGISPLGMALQQGRELGISTMIGLHTLEEVSRPILAAPPYHLFFNLSDAASIREAHRTLLLPAGAERIFPALRPGECMFRQAQSCWPLPLLGVIDPLPPHRGAPRTAYDVPCCRPSQSLSELPQLRKALRGTSVAHGHSAEGRLTDFARSILTIIVDNPGLPLGRVFKLAGTVSAGRAKATREELVAGKYIKAIAVQINRSKMWLVESQPAAATALGCPIKRLDGRGGIDHRTYANWLMRWGTLLHLNTAIEMNVPGGTHPIDVAWQVEQGRYRAFEIVCHCETNVVAHLQACLVASRAITQVTIVLPCAKTQRSIERVVGAAGELAGVQDRIDYLPVSTLLKELKL